MSDYIERLRSELLQAEQRKPRRVDFGPLLAVAALVAVLVIGGVVAWPDGRDDFDGQVSTAASPAKTYAVVGDAEGVARVMRERLPNARIALDGDRLAITSDVDVAPYTRIGSLGIYDYEAGRKDQPALTNADIASAEAAKDPTTNQPVVLVKLRPEAQTRFKSLTRTIAQRGGDTGKVEDFQHMAIALDGEIVSLPYINGKINPDGIATDTVQISGDMTRAQAKELAAVLNSGPLPGRLTPQ